MLEEFFNWMEERENIKWSKENGLPKPWTEDPIMQKYKFCNVFREDDTVTKWVKKNIRERWPKHRNLWFALCVARRINLPSTLSHLDNLMVDWDADEAYMRLMELKEQGKQVYNGAYMLTTGGRKAERNEDLCYNILQPLWEKRKKISSDLEVFSDSMENSFNVLATGHTGFSSFLAYEVICDMRYTRYLEKAKDSRYWGNAGPGAMRGLNRIYGRNLNKKLKPFHANEEMVKLLNAAEKYISDDWVENLEIREIEHSLCEFDKYQRIKTGQSSMLRRYKNG